jgi:hypothetical protein
MSGKVPSVSPVSGVDRVAGAADGFLFYAMPCVEGESLHDRLTREKQRTVAASRLDWPGVRRRHVSGRRGIASMGAVRSVARPPSIRQSKDWILVAALDGPADEFTLAVARGTLEYKPVKRLFVHSPGGSSVSARRL